MHLMRTDPFRDLENLSARWNRAFSNPLSFETQTDGSVFGDWTPAMDIEESDREYLIRADLPSLKREDVKVGIADGVLTVEGERKHDTEERGKRFHRVERGYGRFVRKICVPTDVDQQKVSADFSDGVLNLHLPKSESAKPRAVDIKVT
jgi:HSP20 family protein